MVRSSHSLPFLMTTFALVLATSANAAPRNGVIELFLDSQVSSHVDVREIVEEFVEQRGAIRLHVLDVSGDNQEAVSARLQSIGQHFRIHQPQLPFVYGCNAYVAGANADVHSRLVSMFRIDVFVRAGCTRCARGKAFLKEMMVDYPAFEVKYHDLVNSSAARNDLNTLVSKYKQAAASVPVFHMCNKLTVGFDQPATTGARLRKQLDYWTTPQSKKVSQRMRPRFGQVALLSTLIAYQPPPAPLADEDALPPPPLPMPDTFPGPDEPGEFSLPPPDDIEEPQSTTITLPWLGPVSLADWGMPLFTIIIGLVDGFNPCAMWVLLFLLSILVNLKDRRRILAVAGTFVFISGAAYFAFMAAWLNVFMLIGFLRPIQIALAILAIVIGSIHIKDFFAFKQGISLSIPESAKPTIYARVRNVVNAKNLTGAIIGAAVLAVFVNIVELLCTAGLPALYSEVLTMQGYPMWENYAYLLLYNLAYMFDDSLMVAIVVITLGKRKMQETQGRWLKLISGAAIALLGLIMLLKPDWLL